MTMTMTMTMIMIQIDIGDKATLRRVLQDKYNDLGSMSFHQAAVLFNFIVLVLLWFFRDPQFITGKLKELYTTGKLKGLYTTGKFKAKVEANR